MRTLFSILALAALFVVGYASPLVPRNQQNGIQTMSWEGSPSLEHHLALLELKSRVSAASNDTKSEDVGDPPAPSDEDIEAKHVDEVKRHVEGKTFMTISSPIYSMNTFFAKSIKSPTGNLTIESVLRAPAARFETMRADVCVLETVNTNNIVSPSLTLTLNGDVKVPGVVLTNQIKAPSGGLRVSNDLTVDNALRSKSIEATRAVISGSVDTDSVRPPSGTLQVFGDANVEGQVTTPQIDSPGRNLTIRGDVNVISSISTPAVVVGALYAKSNKTINVQGSLALSGAVKTKTIRAVGKLITIDGNVFISGEQQVKSMDIEALRNSNGGVVGVTGDVSVSGTVATDFIKAPSGQLTLQGGITVNGALKSDLFEAVTVSSSLLQTDVVTAPSGSLKIDGHVEAGHVNAKDGLSVNGFKQWQMTHHEDFEGDEAEGWSQNDITKCGIHSFLGGPCKFGGHKVTKTFENLPPHTQLQVSGRFHYIDSWDGESAFAEIDGHRVWADFHEHGGEKNHGVNMCGDETPERKFSSPMSATIPHTGDKVTVTFGSTLDEHACNESWGVDDVAVHVR